MQVQVKGEIEEFPVKRKGTKNRTKDTKCNAEQKMMLKNKMKVLQVPRSEK